MATVIDAARAMERTIEIGILKALGMKSRAVLLIFLFESVIIGLIGAVIGISSGLGSGKRGYDNLQWRKRILWKHTGNQTGSFGGMTIPLNSNSHNISLDLRSRSQRNLCALSCVAAQNLNQ
jgi:ABC-type antimicrobial peptide transport system permease subunit